MIGQTIAHYKITAKLGEGDMGEVYLAFDSMLDQMGFVMEDSAVL